MKKHIDKQIVTIHEVFDSFDEKKSDALVFDCINAKKNSNSIIALGLGKNISICEKFVGTLNSVGINAQFLHINSAVHGDMGIIRDGDVIILLSKSGETEEAIYLSRFLRLRKVSLWLLTCNEKSTLSEIIPNTIVLNITHEGDKWNIIPNNSSVIFLIFLQALAMKIIEELDVNLEIFKQNHPGGNIGKILREKTTK